MLRSPSDRMNRPVIPSRPQPSEEILNRATMTALLCMAFLFEIQCDYLKTSNNTRRPT